MFFGILEENLGVELLDYTVVLYLADKDANELFSYNVCTVDHQSTDLPTNR